MLSMLRSRRPGHATVVAYVALFVALGGSSYAALKVTSRNVPKDALTGADIKNLTGKDVRNNSLTGADVKNLGSGDVANGKLLAEDFAPGQLPAGSQGVQGPQGEKGEKGDEGDPGEAGADGATGSGLLSGHVSGLPSAHAGTAVARATPNGLSVNDATVSQIASLSPNRTLVARDLAAQVKNDVIGTASVRIELVAHPQSTSGDPTQGTPTPLSCLITGTPGGSDDRSCTATGPMIVPPASVIFMRITVSSPAGIITAPERASWGITVEPG